MIKLKCKCGEVLEEGVLGCLWCPKCKNKWKIPEDKKDVKGYYINITYKGKPI